MKQISPELLETIVQKLVDGLNPEKIFLFGSHAYGSPTESSDIDLLVIVPSSTEPRHLRARQAYACLWGITAPVEIFVATAQEVEEAMGSSTSFLKQIIQSGRLLYG